MVTTRPNPGASSAAPAAPATRAAAFIPTTSFSSAEEVKTVINHIRQEIGKVFVGHNELVDEMIAAILAGGHVLLEGVPGLGKTLLVRTIGRVLDLSFARIQFTPDLMPADILGTNVLSPVGSERVFHFQRGPLFAHVILADEINRATPKTQSALLEAMQELKVTVGGQSYELPQPFFVLATQNPIEMEGTYPLPEAQIDRFLFKLEVGLPDLDELRQIIERTTGAAVPEARPVIGAGKLLELQALVRQVPLAAHVRDFALRLVMATHPQRAEALPVVKNYVRFGASPRGAQALILAAKAWALMAGRFNVSHEDIQRLVLPALRHRLLLNFEAEAEMVTSEKVLAEIIAAVPREDGA
ncbi:MAG TPA: MoxR family ATPase [Firmicutes bacterium]|nr:MoxR family ATPase [Bacillota bacterium]